MKLSIDELRMLNSQILALYGYSQREIEILQNILLYAQLRGNYQFFVHFASQENPHHNSNEPITIEKETKLSALLHGHGQDGMIVMHKAMELVHQKAKEHGFGIVGTKGCLEGTGAIGYYVEELAKHGLIGWAFSGSTKRVAPFGSYQPIFGTNPLAVGFPTTDDPIVLDMATAIIPFFKVVEAHIAGKSLPAEVAYNADGELTEDPAEALEGALRCLDSGPRGSGLSLVVEALTGPLVSSVMETSSDDKDCHHGNLIFAFDPELLTDKKIFNERMSQLKQSVKNCKVLHSIQEILVPGEIGQRQAKRALEQGYIEMDDSIYHLFRQKLHALQAELNEQSLSSDERVIFDDSQPS